jgi:predicted PurR-regulated permease PerM
MQNPTTSKNLTAAQSRELPPPNPITGARHRREVFRQVTLPFLLGLLVFTVFVVLGWLGTTLQASLWADIALIFLIILLGFAAFVFLVISAALAYVIIAANRGIPPYTRLAQDKVDLIGQHVRRVSDRAAMPIINIQSRLARLRTLAEKMGLRRKKG